jgi:N4-gp56 family major capsid protein
MQENLYGSLYWRQLGTQVTIPRGHQDKVKLSRWNTPITITNGQAALNANTAIVKHAEATAISTFGLCATNITGQVTGWAGARGYTDKFVIMSMANFMEGALESLSRELAIRLDAYARTKNSAVAFTQYAVSVAGVKPTANKVPTANALFGKNLARIRPLMKANGCPAWSDGTYVGLCHDLSYHDMVTDISASGWLSVARYNNAREIFKGEMGEFHGIRWLFTNTSVLRLYGAAGTTATLGLSAAATGSNAYIFSPDSFYNLELETGGVEVIHQPLGSAGTADPGAQLGSIAVKVYSGVMPTAVADRRIMRFVHGNPLGY